MTRNLPRPASSSELYLAAIHDELAAIRSHLDGSAPRPDAARGSGGGQPSEPLSGMPADSGGWDDPPEPCGVVTARGSTCGRMRPCRYHGDGR